MKKSVIIHAAIVIFIIMFAIVGSYVNCNTCQEIYNNGTCQECGGHYHIVGTPTHRHQFYIYECDKCGNSFQSLSLMKKSGE